MEGEGNMRSQILNVKAAIKRVFKPDYFQALEEVNANLDALEEGIMRLNGDQFHRLQLVREHDGVERRKKVFAPAP